MAVLWTISGPSPVLVGTVLLKHSASHYVCLPRGCLWTASSQLSSCRRDCKQYLTFLTLGTSFVEDSFSGDWEVGDSFGMIQAHTSIMHPISNLTPLYSTGPAR